MQEFLEQESKYHSPKEDPAACIGPIHRFNEEAVNFMPI
jgi:hypothetical protein